MAGTRGSILIICRDSAGWQPVADWLSRQGYAWSVARDLEEGIRLRGSEHFDAVVFTDEFRFDRRE